MALRTGLIIATKGRPEVLGRLLAHLGAQSVPPTRIVVSATGPEDIAAADAAATQTLADTPVEIIFGAAGLTAQRNRALLAIRDDVDIVTFLDDDFIPSRFWIERLQNVMAARPDIVSASGLVLADGAGFGGIDWADGLALVEARDREPDPASFADSTVRSGIGPYGCNMIFRAAAIRNMQFDERLVLYGWLEDLDFSFRTAGAGWNSRVRWNSMIWTDYLWGVHLGTRTGRVPGVRFGYSQVANSWYLMLKGVLPPYYAARNILRSCIGNAVGYLRGGDPWRDRRGLLAGNLLALKDVMLGRGRPERAAEL